MRLVFDAKRYFHNRRGLGNYSRDVVRLIREYAPEWDVTLLDRSGVRRSMPVPLPEPGAIYHGLSGEIPLGMAHRGWKTIVTMHDAIFVRYPELYSPTYRWLFRQKVQYASDHADIVLCISEQTKRDMMEFFGTDERKIRVVYQGCSGIFRQPPSRPDTLHPQDACFGQGEVSKGKYWLQVGAVEPRKNLTRTIEAAHLLHYDGTVVALGGRTAYADRCEARARELGVRLEIRSHEPFEHFPAWYAGAEVSVYPSVFEGFGIPILEAMCVGVPVVTSTGSCFRETGGDAALYADPTHAESLAGEIERVLNEPGLREEMIRRGKVQADRFSDANVARELIKVYEELRER